MKKYFIKHLLLLGVLTASAIITSCKDDDATYDMPYIEVLEPSISAAYNESAVSFDITSNRQWKVTVYTNSEDEVWYAFNPENGEGNQTIHVDLTVNQGGLRTLVLKVATNTLSEFVTIKQTGESGVIDFVTLFEENVGTTNVSGNTAISEWAAGTYPAGFQRGGEGGAEATYASEGSTNLTVRSTGVNSNGSGGNNVWLPSIYNGATGYFTIDNIKTNGESAAKLTFNRLSNLTTGNTDEWTSDEVNDNYLQVYIIRDGVVGEKLSYKGSISSAWGFVTTEAFDISSATTFGFRFATTHASIGSRIDDLTVETTDEVPTPAEPVPAITGTTVSGISDNSATITGSYSYTGTATITEVGVAYKTSTESSYNMVPMSSVPTDGNVNVTINGLLAGTEYYYYIYVSNANGSYKGEELTFTTTGTATSHIFDEDMGATDVSQNTALAEWSAGTYPNGFKRGGTGGSNASYTGNSANLPTVRKSTANTNGSGGNNIWIPAVSTGGAISYLDIDNISLNGVTAIKMLFNRYANKYSTSDPEWNGDADNDNFLKVYIIRDGVVSEQVSYTGGTNHEWTFVTTDAIDVSDASYIGFRFECVSTIGIRVDDIAIDETTDAPPTIIAPTTTTTEAINLTETTATLTGTFAKGSENITEVGVGYKKSSESNYTTAKMDNIPADGIISVNVIGLTAETNYNFYTYVTTASGTVKGSDASFTTLGSGGGTETEFSAIWNVKGVAGMNSDNNPWSATIVTNTNVTFGGLTAIGITGSTTNNTWGGTGDFSTQNITDPTSYVTVTVTSADKVISMSRISTAVRVSSTGPTSLTYQYRTGGGSFTDIETKTWANSGTTYTELVVDLTDIVALQSVSAGNTVEFRLIPTGASGAAGTWYIGYHATNMPTEESFTISGTYTE